MDEGTVGLIVFFTIAVISALMWHWLVPIYVLATVGATVTTVIAFQVAAYLHLGYLDPFFLIALVTSSVMGAGVALHVGLPFRPRRKPHAVNNKVP
jgi:hypothetical protein